MWSFSGSTLNPRSASREGFEGAPSTTGHLSSVNGIAYIDRRIFAVVERQNDDWYLLREGVHQAVLCVHPVT